MAAVITLHDFGSTKTIHKQNKLMKIFFGKQKSKEPKYRKQLMNVPLQFVVEVYYYCCPTFVVILRVFVSFISIAALLI